MRIEIHRVAAARGVVWFTRSLELAGQRPGAMLGALGWQFLLMLGVMALSVVVASVVLLARGVTGAEIDTGAVATVVVVIFVLFALYQPLMYAGILHLLREIEGNRPARARDVLAPLAAGRVGVLASLGLVQVAATALNVGAMHAFGGDAYLREYVAFMQAAMHGQLVAEPIAEHALMMGVVQIMVGYFAWSAQVYAAALIQFHGAPAWPAVLASLRAAAVNVLPLTLAGLLLSLGLIGGWIVAVLLLVLLSTLLAAASKLLASVVTIALVALLLAATFALMFSGVLLSWRDMFARESEAPESTAKAPTVTAEL